MDVILGVIVALVIVSSVDRYLYPEEYAVEPWPARNRSRRPLPPARSFLRRLSGSLYRGRTLSASHRCSVSQVSPWLTSESYERVSARQ